MVEGDRDVADVADDDLPVANDGARADPVDPEDSDLGVVDERSDEDAAELAGARDGEGAAAELLRLQGAGSGRVGEARGLGGELLERPGVAASDDRHDEALLGLDGDPEVVALEIDELVASVVGVVEPSVQLWVLLQPGRGRLQHERHESAEVDVREVALLRERDRRNLLVRPRESLGDLTPDPADGLPALERLVLLQHKLLSTGAADIGLDDPPVRPGATQRSQIDA